jgi:hypothetical protein
MATNTRLARKRRLMRNFNNLGDLATMATNGDKLDSVATALMATKLCVSIETPPVAMPQQSPGTLRKGSRLLELPLDGWMVGWTPPTWCELGEPYRPGSIEVGPWPDTTGISRRYTHKHGCCFLERHGMSKAARIGLMFIDFHTCVARDGIDPQKAHEAFLNIAEYRRRISPDCEGAV